MKERIKAMSCLSLKKILILSGGLDYEKSDIIKSSNDISSTLIKYNYIVEVIGLFGESQSFKEILKFSPDLCFIVDPFYKDKIGNIADIRLFLNDQKIVYTGSTPIAASICKDKSISKEYFKKLNVLTPNHIIVKEIMSYDKIVDYTKKLGLPVILKPLMDGASIGVNLCNNNEEVYSLIQTLIPDFKYLILEEYIDGKDITVGVIGTGKSAIALPPIELELISSQIYDYATKINPDSVNRHVPARISKQQLKDLELISVAIHNEIGCRSFSRIDYRINGLDNVCIEINASPALGDDEHIARAARAIGISYDDLILRIIKENKEIK